MRVGAIDLGSNSIRLLVADVSPGDFDRGQLGVVARAGEACRLARGLQRSGRIDSEIAERAGVIAREFARRARGLGATHIVCGGTAALRGASNGAEVAAAIGQECGVPVRILSGEDEARLVYRAVVLGLGSAARRSSCLVFDIGGGSTEVVSGVGDQAGRWTSLDFGAVSLTERHLLSDPPRSDEVELLRNEVRQQIMHICAYMPKRCPLLAGVGGAVTLLAARDVGLTVYDHAALEGHAIPRARLEELIQRLLASAHDERLRWPIMGEGRADIAVAGALVVGLLAERFPSDALVCSTQGLRYGLVRLAAEEASKGAPPAAGDGEGTVPR
jgi:exopolyphosphatase/guanosine-5'-triphosphate,3'-diphosphate pyrophosphatase